MHTHEQMWTETVNGPVRAEQPWQPFIRPPVVPHQANSVICILALLSDDISRISFPSAYANKLFTMPDRGTTEESTRERPFPI